MIGNPRPIAFLVQKTGTGSSTHNRSEALQPSPPPAADAGPSQPVEAKPRPRACTSICTDRIDEPARTPWIGRS
jgi:hypothetical protein